ncbi:radical SAM protein [Myxococcota bacterium]|nr:radical SAM protein [Myxococcota bacterium]MBU1383162.1 radical SAM protein [Myxococcota bacterium]MBU1497202.1 radical SAM protein [Myxococcota bacterium]
MEVIFEHGNEEIAKVYALRMDDGSAVECVESVQPPISRDKKWVLIISTLKGCPVKCSICDAGLYYRGKLSWKEMLAQIDFMVSRRYPDRRVPAEKFKIQFARMGDPAFNDDVPLLLEKLPDLFNAPGLMPSVSTIAPASCGLWIENLKRAVHENYSPGQFQMQFSIHTTDFEKRRELIHAKTLTFSEMAIAGESIFREGDRKITLNFAAVKGYPLDGLELRKYFNPEKFLVKLTPVNPTRNMMNNGLCSLIDPDDPKSNEEIVQSLSREGWEVILSIGELEENQIGSNCGMYAICDETKDKL